jgi:phosphoglycerate-specific signal transduction histidine kinase
MMLKILQFGVLFMKPTPSISCQMNNFFRSRLTQMINMNHELVQLANRIDWSHIDTQLQPFLQT